MTSFFVIKNVDNVWVVFFLIHLLYIVCIADALNSQHTFFISNIMLMLNLIAHENHVNSVLNKLQNSKYNSS